ncbi:Ig-like domain-containing protein [Mucilaginibacter phyllosphaerae]|uniref:Glucose/Sorbosone dehydrogenase domain-containing protein n=1 Tax=Mucilaginibacter phyllosphaerae TaxID=1812349 RepID=A0A4Y8A9H6_9SPHI|nr:Ig-like domain-containing protein [Mucilaginibacter phyllosphaerae]MBB3969694.1 hypothetical protein [Mucilaginibacter phyllosphaerae]TEW65078.1 hypothetical protein E2R65_14270 [Mucilaginibacter phyllosphaerae]GGH18110.1 hypothetical protein GCM10007352_28630 [Mucilaginibacter phyllosphaerae]
MILPVLHFLKKHLLVILTALASVFFVVIFNQNFFGKNSTLPQANYRDTETFNLAEAPVIEPLKINFQDEKTVPPPGWLKDIGEPFGPHPGIYQGAPLVYGWRAVQNKLPVDLKGNGRARTEPEDVLLSTFMHMQSDDISIRYGMFEGIKANAFWELKLLNGVYKVSVAVGDATGKAEEVDCINIEGVKTISNFKPFGKMRSPGRFKSASSTVTVDDGYLTIDALGGKNTKLCYVEVTPVTMMPYIYLLSKTQNLLVKKGSKQARAFNVKIKNSLGENAAYNLSVTHSLQSAPWLHINQKTTTDTVINVDYMVADQLPVGTYTAKINAVANGYTGNSLAIQLRVVSNNRPYVITATPVNGSRINNNFSIAANSLYIPAIQGFKGGIDNTTINNNTVKLLKINSGKEISIPGVVQGTGGGDAISFTPSRQLEPNSNYKFVITDGVKSYSHLAFIPFESYFSTSAAPIDSANILNASFTKISMPGTQNKKYTSLVFGPDGKFYALKIDGGIERYAVDHTSGMLTGKQEINTLIKKRGQSTAIGLTFDQASTAGKMVAWVSYSSAGLNAAPVFDGKISKLSGPNLQYEEQVIINLPRSTRDHMVNSMAFGPDGALYISVGSNSSAGLYDKGWQRDETLLAGAILRLDTKMLQGLKLPLDVKTTANQDLINKASGSSPKMADGTYNPYSSNSALTIYASGIRNAYDLIWHSNGQLYIPANGSGGGGNSPASVNGTKRPDNTFYNGPDIVSTEDIPVQHDWLFRVNPNRGVGYYGHPNPLRGEYVINRGYPDNPTYSPKVKPDVNYRGAAFDFGFNKSPNGVIEYKSAAFNGVLKGKLLVCRFSGGGDIMVLEPGSMKRISMADNSKDGIYDIVRSSSGSGNYGLQGMVGFANPLDIIEDVTNGNLYVSEFNWNENPNLTSQITLLKVNDKPKKWLANNTRPRK